MAEGLSNDPTTIQRVLFVGNNIHVYGIPPLSSNKGFNASSWTSPTQPTAQEIFTARLRVVERSVNDRLSADVLLEDPKSGELFAGAPYTSPAAVQQALDSSRFFAVRVQGEGGMKATLGVGFEDRGPALDFSIALADVRKLMGMETTTTGQPGRGSGAKTADKNFELDSKKDFNLKEGEKIHIQLGNKGRRAAPANIDPAASNDKAALFSIAPPPSGSKSPSQVPGFPSISHSADKQTASDLGFDDGEFGEFQ